MLYGTGLWNLDFEKSFLWNLESWALESGIHLKESGSPLTIESSTIKESGIQYQESRIQNPWRGIQNTRLSWIP